MLGLGGRGPVELDRDVTQAGGEPLPRAWATWSKVTFSSCPDSALVAGVKIGSGSRLARSRPEGSEMPQTFPDLTYSR